MLIVTTICTGTYQIYCSSNNTVLYCCHHLQRNLPALLLIQQHCPLLLPPFALGSTRLIPHPTTLSSVVATICTRTYQIYSSSNNTVIYCGNHLHGDSLDLFLAQQRCRLLSSPPAQGPTKFTVHPTALSSAVANTSTGITICKIYFIQEQYRLLSPQFTLGSTRISFSSHSTVASCDHALYSHRNEGPAGDFSSSTTLLSSSSDVQHCCQLWRLCSHRNSLHLFLNKQNSAVC